MNIKQLPNDKQYLTLLHKMSAELRPIKALELFAIAIELFLTGLHQIFTQKTAIEIKEPTC